MRIGFLGWQVLVSLRSWEAELPGRALVARPVVFHSAAFQVLATRPILGC
jgi:hypothetical protein